MSTETITRSSADDPQKEPGPNVPADGTWGVIQLSDAQAAQLSRLAEQKNVADDRFNLAVETTLLGHGVTGHVNATFNGTAIVVEPR